MRYTEIPFDCTYFLLNFFKVFILSKETLHSIITLFLKINFLLNDDHKLHSEKILLKILLFTY